MIGCEDTQLEFELFRWQNEGELALVESMEDGRKCAKD